MHRPAYSTPVSAPWQPSPAPLAPLRRWLARRLRRAGAALQLLARQLTPSVAPPPPTRVPMTLPQLEFHADAGAPEGALYVDGDYVGRLGMTRL